MNHNLLLLIISGALINNVVLSQFLGICSFLGVSKQMKASASLGVAVIFVGEDLDVLLALSDRILVIGQGQVAGILDARTADKEEIGVLMTKGRTEERGPGGRHESRKGGQHK